MRRSFWPTLFIVLWAPSLWAQQWEQITDEAGIRVWQREVAGTSLVEFRGRGKIAAPIQAVFAVIHNADREKEWMESCSDSFTIQYKSPLHAFTYNRTASPVFFIADRDVVLEATTAVSAEKKTIRVSFKSVEHAKVPPKDGVVRMPKLSGYWEMERDGPNATVVTYQVQADPGGALPGWLVNLASKSLPFDTLVRLREQVKAPGYDHDLAVLEIVVDWAAFES